MRTQREGGHLQTTNRGFREKPNLPMPNSGFLGSKIPRKFNSVVQVAHLTGFVLVSEGTWNTYIRESRMKETTRRISLSPTVNQ